MKIKAFFARFWEKVVDFFENYDIHKIEYILATFVIAIVGICVLFLYMKLCFGLIKSAIKNKSSGLAIVGIILSGVLPGLIWYNKITNEEPKQEE